MNFRTIIIAASLYFAIFLFAHPTSVKSAAAPFRAVHDLSRPVSAETTLLVAPAGMTVDRITTDRFVVPLAVIDVSAKLRTDPEYRLGFEDVADYEQRYGTIPAGAVIATQSAGIDPTLIDFLRVGRKIYGVTLDAERDPEGAKAARAHGLYLLTNLQALGTVPRAGAILIVAPLKTENAAEAPVRVYALMR